MGFLLRDSLEHLTLELGLPGNPFEYPTATWKNLLTDCWLKSAWEFMEKYNIKVRATTPQLQLLRTEDSFLMLRFYQVGMRDPERLKRLNLCSKFLHAVSLADICNAAGGQILDEA